jgi:hypothetical protein
VVRESDDARNIPALIADLSVRGVWQAQTTALFDIRVVDTDALSYLNRTVTSVLTSAETAKKAKYHQACEQRRASFTPFVVSVVGMLAKEAKFFLKRLSETLAERSGKSHSELANWTRTHISLAVLRATHHCLRGSRRPWKSISVEDGALPSI